MNGENQGAAGWMSGGPVPLLSKTRFGAGLQCMKRLYLECYSPELAGLVGAGQQALLDTGSTVGELARDLFPGGRLIAEGHFAHDSATGATRRAIADETVPAIYEAAFTFDGIRVRVDILRRVGPAIFDLIEVKSSTSVKPEHIPDAAIQVYVTEGFGQAVRRVYLAHVDSSYTYEGGPYDLGGLFRCEDVTAQVRAYVAGELPGGLAAMKDALVRPQVPPVAIGRHCKQPYPCPFYAHCRERLSSFHVEQLPGARADLLERLLGAGIKDIRDIPPGFPGLSAAQRRVRECVLGGGPYCGPGLGEALSRIQYPLLFLDFETFAPALPIYAGTHPYQVIPFQWSLHLQDEDGGLEHRSFLHTGEGDPRPAFIESLLDAAVAGGSIVVYSDYEQTRVRQLAEEFPEHSGRLLGLCDRMFDLLRPIRAHYYHPGLHGSYSIKSVLPVLVPDLGYGDLAIQDGVYASAAFARMVRASLGEAERSEVRLALLEYCRRDTEAMVRVLGALRQMAG